MKRKTLLGVLPLSAVLISVAAAREPGPHVQNGQWNRYEITAVGSRIKTAVNGHPCADFDDPQGKREGIVALQLHAGGPLEVRFRKFLLESAR